MVYLTWIVSGNLDSTIYSYSLQLGHLVGRNLADTVVRKVVALHLGVLVVVLMEQPRRVNPCAATNL